MGLLRKDKTPKQAELYHFWSAETMTVKFKEMIELNSCWREEHENVLVADNAGLTVDTATLREGLESETVPIPSLITIDSELIMGFAQNSIVKIKEGFFTFKKSDVIFTDLPEALFLAKEKEMEHRNWKTLGKIAKYTAFAGGAVAAGAFIGHKLTEK